LILNGMPCIALSQSPTSYVGIIPNTTTPGYATLVAASTAGVATLSNVFRYTIVLDVGNGSDGVFNPTSNVLIDTTINGGIFNYTSFTIPAGVTVTARGPSPLGDQVHGRRQHPRHSRSEGRGRASASSRTPTTQSISSVTALIASAAAAAPPAPVPGAGGGSGGRVEVVGALGGIVPKWFRRDP
jgi:hypothetical protein